MSSISSQEERDEESASKEIFRDEESCTSERNSARQQQQQLPDAAANEEDQSSTVDDDAPSKVKEEDEEEKTSYSAALLPSENKLNNNNNKIEAFEIEMGRKVSGISDQELDSLADERNSRSSNQQQSSHEIAAIPSQEEEDEERPHDDMESLLGSNQAAAAAGGGKGGARRKQRQQQDDRTAADSSRHLLSCCGRSDNVVTKFGNLSVPYPAVYMRTGGWGVVGPHWFGPPCVVGILVFATYYFAYQCSIVNLHRPFTAATCLLFGIITLYQLLNTAYRNPGIIVPGTLSLPDPIPRTYRWCEECNYYQPPSAAHCNDCNVCIAGFDHHCVWMGTCIGAGNFKPFVRFNLGWLTYLIYAVVWVSIIAPIVEHAHKNGGEEGGGSN